MTVNLTKDDAQEVLHKLCVLAHEPELCGDYDITPEQGAELSRSVPAMGGEWRIPDWAEEAVQAEMADHVEVLRRIANAARSGGEVGQALRIAKQAARLERMFSPN